MANGEKGNHRLREITGNIEQGIRELFQSNRYTQYLRTMSQFHHYSLNNTILIYMQMPDASLVAGFNKWRDQFERNVRHGEKAIKIIAPAPSRKKIDRKILDQDMLTPILDSNGNALTEEVEVKIPLYKVVSVFDVSQTEGKPLPMLAESLTGKVSQYEVILESLRRSSPVQIDFEAMNPSTDGYFSKRDQRIAIRSGMSEVQTVSAVIHEITHAKLHDYKNPNLIAGQENGSSKQIKPKDRRTEEVEAESVSYAVCQYYGIQTSGNSFGYIASWSQNKELPELRSSLETINEAASNLITDIEQNFAELIKKRGLNLTSQISDTAHIEIPSNKQVHKKNSASQKRRDGAMICFQMMKST